MSERDYGFGSRLLHRLALGSNIVAETCFDLERLFEKPGAGSDDHHVFVSGLARAGTTVVMRTLYDSGEFRSLTYRDMPFVLMPGFWKKLSARSRTNAVEGERVHGDRIQVGFDSPEAFEEVFWRVFCGRDYIREDRLTPHTVSHDIGEQFALFVQHVVESREVASQSRYLSKNNNNLLRMPAIKAIFPNSLFVVPFRDPVQQAISLLSQHQRFCRLHNEDRFAFRYMVWLGHHEFGLTHKPFRFDADENDSDSFTPDDVNYWLCVWKNSYRYILKTAPEGSVFVGYEKLCSDPESVLGQVCAATKLVPPAESNFQSAPSRTVDGVDRVLKQECSEIYQQLFDRAQ